jgi:hypothetical protein
MQLSKWLRQARIKSLLARQEPYFLAAGTDLMAGWMKIIRIFCEKVPLKSCFLLFQRYFFEKSTATSAIPCRITVPA